MLVKGCPDGQTPYRGVALLGATVLPGSELVRLRYDENGSHHFSPATGWSARRPGGQPAEQARVSS